MEDDAPVIYGLEFQARALTPQTAETDAIRFLVGTQSLKYDNQNKDWKEIGQKGLKIEPRVIFRCFSQGMCSKSTQRMPGNLDPYHRF
ncbi:EIPR1 isoform 5 [Pan troglodytes]|uniref:EIPR1 isoform 5 n=1 Tax=Pan troglodytes TaxID=9598 RepID=A0A2J8NMB2_PANTR|nr:EIPR1 isoform 5 [Pan troglodytes]